VPNSTTRACPTMASRRYLLQGWPLRTGPCSSGGSGPKMPVAIDERTTRDKTPLTGRWIRPWISSGLRECVLSAASLTDCQRETFTKCSCRPDDVPHPAFHRLRLNHAARLV
jgi:hypothetical protein